MQYGHAMRHQREGWESHYPNGPDYSQRDGYERQQGYEGYGRSEERFGRASSDAGSGFYLLGHMSCFGAGSDPASERAFVPNTRPAECKEQRSMCHAPVVCCFLDTINDFESGSFDTFETLFSHFGQSNLLFELTFLRTSCAL
eukprot:s848_g22.t2